MQLMHWLGWAKPFLQNRFSFESRTFRTYAGPKGELLHITHTTKTIYRRPDRLSVSVTGDDGSIKILYDGKVLVLYAEEASSISACRWRVVLTKHSTFSKSVPEPIIHWLIC